MSHHHIGISSKQVGAAILGHVSHRHFFFTFTLILHGSIILGYFWSLLTSLADPIHYLLASPSLDLSRLLSSYFSPSCANASLATLLHANFFLPDLRRIAHDSFGNRSFGLLPLLPHS